MKTPLVLVFMLGSAVAMAQQVCDSGGYALSSPTSRFQDHGDGTTTDQTTQLMWMRCSIGQAWSGATCSGSAERHGWRSAQAAAAAVNAAGTHFYADWRLPQIRELATIAERQCHNPRINLQVFPNTAPAMYWTVSTRPAGGSAMAAFALSFAADGVAYLDKDDALPVRLVRNAR